MNPKEVAYAIGTFIEKYPQDTDKVKLPTWDFAIKSLFGIQVSETSLTEVSKGLWTFNAIAKTDVTDARKTVSLIKDIKIAGNATISFYPNRETKELLLQVEAVTISQIKDTIIL